MSGADELPTEWLQGTPFHTYVLPGLILFAVVGGRLLLAAAAVFQRSAPGRAAAIAAGVVLLGWIAVETALIGYVSWLQPVTAVAGLAVVCLALLLEDADRTATRERVRGDRMAPVRLDRDALSDHWLSVFDSADLALTAARYELPEDELRERRRRLKFERTATMRVLEELAADPGWIHVLERLEPGVPRETTFESAAAAPTAKIAGGRVGETKKRLDPTPRSRVRQRVHPRRKTARSARVSS